MPKTVLLSRVSDDKYVLRLEALHLLLVMCSTQLYTPAAAALPGAHPLTEAILRESHLAGPLLQVRQPRVQRILTL